jgi:hypothetical protein
VFYAGEMAENEAFERNCAGMLFFERDPFGGFHVLSPVKQKSPL